MNKITSAELDHYRNVKDENGRNRYTVSPEGQVKINDLRPLSARIRGILLLPVSAVLLGVEMVTIAGSMVRDYRSERVLAKMSKDWTETERAALYSLEYNATVNYQRRMDEAGQ